MAGFGGWPPAAGPAVRIAGTKRKTDQVSGSGSGTTINGRQNAIAGPSTRTTRSYMARNDDGDDDEYEYEILPKRPKHLDPAKDSMDLMNTSLDESESDYAPGPSNASLGIRKRPHKKQGEKARTLPQAGSLTGTSLADPALGRTLSNVSNGSSVSCEGMPALPVPRARGAGRGRLGGATFALGESGGAPVILLSDSEDEDVAEAAKRRQTFEGLSNGKGQEESADAGNGNAQAGPSRIGADIGLSTENGEAIENAATGSVPINPADGSAQPTTPVAKQPFVPPEPKAEPSVEPEPSLDPASAALARILEIIPDADPAWVLAKIHTILPPALGPIPTDAPAPGAPIIPFAQVPMPAANPFPGTVASTDPVECVLGEAFEKGYDKVKVSAEGSRRRFGAFGGLAGSGFGQGFKEGSKRKRKARGPGAAEMYKSQEYRKAKRAGRFYVPKVKDYLEGVFDRVPLPYIRAVIRANDNLLVPSYYAIQTQFQKPAEERGYTQLKAGRKGKGRAASYDEDAHLASIITTMDSDDSDDDATNGNDNDRHNDKRYKMDNAGDFDDEATGNGRCGGKGRGRDSGEVELGLKEYAREKRWLLETLDNEKREQEEKAAKAAAKELALAEGNGMECPVCCEDELVEDMAQCQDGHLFCKSCARRQAEYSLGDQKHEIFCIGSTDCKMPILDSSLYSCISTKLIGLYERLKQQAELQAAGLEGLESCPECSYAAIIENPHERLFRCENEDCGRISCRDCWKVEHLPKTCKEAEAEKHLDKRHAIEDAMSDALIRTCPKASCKTKYLKEEGCNKMICPKCRTIQCYVCRKMIPNGYDHFEKDMIDPDNPRIVTKCLLWEMTADRDQQAIIAARDAARLAQEAALAADGQALPEKILDVEAPDAPPAQPAPPARHVHLPVGGLAPARMPPIAANPQPAVRVVNHAAPARIPPPPIAANQPALVRIQALGVGLAQDNMPEALRERVEAARARGRALQQELHRHVAAHGGAADNAPLIDDGHRRDPQAVFQPWNAAHFGARNLAFGAP